MGDNCLEDLVEHRRVHPDCGLLDLAVKDERHGPPALLVEFLVYLPQRWQQLRDIRQRLESLLLRRVQAEPHRATDKEAEGDAVLDGWRHAGLQQEVDRIGRVVAFCDDCAGSRP